MLYCRLIYMLSMQYVRLTIKVKVGISESFRVGWYPHKITRSSHLKRTSHLRNGIKQLLLSHSKPHGPVSTDTISRWCKAVLSTAGVDVSKFKGHSTRAASTSFLASHNININIINMMSAGWSNERTFQQYYHKPTESEFNFGEAILKSFVLSTLPADDS